MGGRSGNGSMLRSVGRAVRAGGVGNGSPNLSRTTHHKPISSSAKLRSLSSSSSSSSCDLPITLAAVTPTWPSPVYHCDEWDWEAVEAVEDDRVATATEYIEEGVFGRVPSSDEVHSAFYSLQQFLYLSDSEETKERYITNAEKDIKDHITVPAPLMHRVSSIGSDLDWKEPSPRAMLQTQGSHRVYDAFQLLQTEPAVQRMVMSLSSDKAVWDAVLNNEAVQELRESYDAAERDAPQSQNKSSDVPSPAVHILSLIFDSTKAKLMGLFDKITGLLSPLSQDEDGEKATGAAGSLFEKSLRSSLMISVVILLIVILTRANKA